MSSWSKISKVINDLDKAQEKQLDKAATYLRIKLKEKVDKKIVSEPGDPPGKHSGNLKKGIKFTREPGKRFVGVGKPASHAHLLEFGTGPRIVKNYLGQKGVPVAVGAVAPRPFMIPTFEEEKENVEKILSEEWL
jgi:HK97 gp10 family phage protein